MSLDPRRLLVLRAVRQRGSVLAAARALQLTPSGVSQHLAKLEKEVGLALVDREHRGGGRAIRLTPAGDTLADSADRVAEALAEADRGLEQFREGAHGPLRVGGFSVALSELAAPVAMRMAMADPAMDPCIFEMSDSEGVGKVAAGDLDLLLSVRPGAGDAARPPELVEVDLMRDPYRVIIPDTWPTDVDARTLLARSWITTSSGPATRRKLERLCRRHKLELDAHDIGTGSAPTLIALVAHGLGATIIPALTLRQHPASNVRVSNAIADPGSRVVTALYRKDAAPGVIRLLAELQRFAGTEVEPDIAQRVTPGGRRGGRGESHR
ncbi:LysR family transcriptional regulator [Amycolatopsis umgeniensis]|uniref:Molybdate transport repressor ModE-like protein n=1 Tax=Amycolatopsis umgeniensis TaxID=336628 RepID=A0A841B3R4_9PSEU|nr:LysR family transcriptional regulator [Amycolatopsis umgeniensis]MBB5855679.1 molybdate transport repressor ModE-like protein [Amycolatopsis umgeniensis]